jgi:hypothetical protein
MARETIGPPKDAAERAAKRRALAKQKRLFRNYDPEKVLAALRESRGALAGLDREAFFREMHANREQASKGRPGD